MKLIRFLKRKNADPEPKRVLSDGPDAKQVLDEIESDVYAHLKPLGFRRFGRTLHRFVSGDLSQVVSFQVRREMLEPSDKFCVNLGIRIPECAERKFLPVNEKKYYSEAECTLRSRLGTVSGSGEVWFSITENTEAITKRIIEELDRYVLPVFDVLCSREAILARRRDYPQMDTLNNRLISLEECFIYGHLGNMEKAKERFDVYYQSKVDERDHGRTVFLKKGERLSSDQGTVYAAEDGFYTVFNCKTLQRQLDRLDQLAVELGFRDGPDNSPNDS